MASLYRKLQRRSMRLEGVTRRRGGPRGSVHRAYCRCQTSQIASKTAGVQGGFVPDFDDGNDVLADETVAEAMRRGVFSVEGTAIKYRLGHERTERWTDPEERVRAYVVAYLVVQKGYPSDRIKLEVTVPRRTPSDRADVVVYRDDELDYPYLVVECKSAGQAPQDRLQGVEQAFGNATGLEAPFVLYDDGGESQLFVRGPATGYAPLERIENRRGGRGNLPEQYGDVPVYALVAGSADDIVAPTTVTLEARIRRAHALIWAGGRRDPLQAFDEWSKLLFAKVADERTTPTGQPRRFQIGALETSATVATRIHRLFAQARQTDPSIFPPNSFITLPDSKIVGVVRALQEIAFTRTDVDTIGQAFEQFFGSIFRGGLGQYFTMRQLARFSVAFLDIGPEDFVLDPTAGSGGFLLEALLQVWHRVDQDFAGQPADLVQRRKTDFALQHVFGVEIHEILSRICKINLLLHHDGHTNIEANRSFLDSTFQNPRLARDGERFTCIVGNPPFGTDIKVGDDEQLGTTPFRSFVLSRGFNKVDSEQLIVERCVEMLQGQGRFGLILPDGTLNNQGIRSNAPQLRAFLARRGRFLGIVSLPDHAFRKSGAQNKTSILFFEKFAAGEQRLIDRHLDRLISEGIPADEAIAEAFQNTGMDYRVFLGEADQVGYTASGVMCDANDLYTGAGAGHVTSVQEGTILGEYRRFKQDEDAYEGSTSPDTAAVWFSELWRAHSSHRLDPKYHLFKLRETTELPHTWVQARVGDVMHRRAVPEDFEGREDDLFTVMTISQQGEIRRREEGKGHNPPEWRGSYFKGSPGDWYSAQTGDVVFSSIDLWKGCISIVPDEFDGALVSSEFPIYQVTDARLSPQFLQALLRSRFFQRAFRAITTGHSNRRRTQQADFEDIEVAFPPDTAAQVEIVARISDAREQVREWSGELRSAVMQFNNLIDGRGDQELPPVEFDDAPEER